MEGEALCCSKANFISIQMDEFLSYYHWRTKYDLHIDNNETNLCLVTFCYFDAVAIADERMMCYQNTLLGAILAMSLLLHANHNNRNTIIDITIFERMAVERFRCINATNDLMIEQNRKSC